MKFPAVLIGLQLSQTFVPDLQKAVAALRQHQPKAKDAELLEQIFIAGLKSTLDSLTTNNEMIVHGR